MAKMTAKKALLTSILSLLVSVTMLVGTTFAWFTDSVTSGTNRIVAGNLDVEIYHTSASVSEPASVQNRTDLFTDENGDAMLWEPGAVTYENITVKNVGTLSLKYKLNMNVTDYNAVDGTDKTLLDVLKVKILEGDDIIDVIDRASVLALDWTANVQTLGEFEDADVLYAANDVPANEISEKTFQVIVYWLPLSNDNDYNLSNGKTSTDGEPLFVEFGINLVATQYTYEEDSFDDQYDAGTTLPALPVTINKTFKSAAVVNNATANVHIVNASNVKVAELEQSSAQAIINSVNNIIENLENVADQKKPDTDVSTVFTLSIETTETKEDSVTYEIDLNAITTYTTNSDVTATHELSTSEVNNALAVANKIVVASVNIGQDLKEVTVKHSGIPMAQLANADVEEEGYYYNAATGDLTIKTKSFSPFSIEYKTEFVARIGEVGYKTLAAAFEAAKTNDTVVLLQNVRTVDGYKIDKTIALDTNGKTITVETGASYNNRAFKVTSGTFTVYGGGTVDALSENGNGCYGAFRAEIGTELVLSNITLKNYRTNGLNVKLLGATATLNNVKIDSVYGGGIEVTESSLGNNSQKGLATLTDCTFTQATYGDWCSTTLSVSGGSRLVVNSGSYTSENYALYVFSSGGEIEVKGGTFNGNATFGNKTGVAIVAEIDTGTFPGYTGGFRIAGGTFNGDYAITSPAYMSITGGTFDHDPIAYVADGYETVLNSDNRYAVQKTPLARIGDVKYDTIQDAVAAVKNNETIVILKNITIDDTVELNRGDIAFAIDVNGYTIDTAVDNGLHLTVFNVLSGKVTLTDSSNGKTGALNGRCVENNATLIVDDITINAVDVTNGVAAITNKGKLWIKDGVFTAAAASDTWGSSALINAKTGSAIIDGGTFTVGSGNYKYAITNSGKMVINNANVTGYNGAIAISKGSAVVNGGTFARVNAGGNSGHSIYAEGGLIVVNGGQFSNSGGDGSLAYVAGGAVEINGGTFTPGTGAYGPAAYGASSILAINGGTINAKIEDWGGQIRVMGGTFKSAPSKLAAGCSAEQNGDTWTVSGTATDDPLFDYFYVSDYNGTLQISADGNKVTIDNVEYTVINNVFNYNGNAYVVLKAKAVPSEGEIDYFYYYSATQTVEHNTSDFYQPFLSGWLETGENIGLLENITLYQNIAVPSGVQSFNFFFNGYTVTGGKIILKAGQTVICDQAVAGVFEYENGSAPYISEQPDGSYIYTDLARVYVEKNTEIVIKDAYVDYSIRLAWDGDKIVLTAIDGNEEEIATQTIRKVADNPYSWDYTFEDYADPDSSMEILGDLEETVFVQILPSSEENPSYYEFVNYSGLTWVINDVETLVFLKN